MIDNYMAALSGELRVPRRARARILAEVRDHLAESLESGASERDAVQAFGDPHELAARFHEQLAGASARRAGARTALLMVLFVVGCAAAVLGPANHFPVGVIVFVGAQLAIVAGALGCVRWLRFRDGVPADRLADSYRANGLAAASVGVVAVAEMVDAGGHPAVIVGAAVVLAASLAAGVSVARSRARARVVPAGAPAEDALDDLAALARRVPGADRVARTLGAPLREHPWRFCLLVAAACGLALAAQHALAEGVSAPAVWRPLLAAFLIASIEATAVIGCFAAFGRFLGIRRQT